MDDKIKQSAFAKYKWLIILSYIATIPGANFMIGNVGTFCVPDGPCMIPVGFGFNAPSGVIMIGLALVLRDAVHEFWGARYAFFAVIVGAILSYLFANPYIALASFVAFALSEVSDLLVYAKLRAKNKPFAILASGFVGAILDSAAFLLIAFGTLQFIEGQIIGKVMVSIIAASLLFIWRRRYNA
jgi:hypothetical protein